jgi:mitogen-activated protein kinase kinase kinase
VNISDCSSARAILTKVLKKFNVLDDYSNWCIYTIKDRSAGTLPFHSEANISAVRLSDSELLQYCHDPAFPERERLILCKRSRTPGAAEIHRAQEIAKEQRAAAQEKIIAERKETGSALLGRTKTNKLEGFFGERPTSFDRVTPSTPSIGGNSPPSHNSSPREQARPNAKRLRNFFGQRPPSELISSNLAEYFPDHEKNVLEETVRNSIRRSTRMSHAARRFSTATTASSISSRDKDIPPLPPMADAWKDSASISSGTATPPLPRPQRRPVSMRRAVTSASYATSIVESLAEDDESLDVGEMTEIEQSEEVDTLQTDAFNEDKRDTLRLSDSITDTLRLSDSGTDTLRLSDSGTDTIRQTDMNTMIDLSGSDKADEDTKSEDEESEEDDYEEGEFDAVGGGPTRWIRGALIGMGSFGSVYLGMNRTSGELMAVKQVELPSHDVQGEQRKQSMLIALQREIALLRDLTHENIVHYIGTLLFPHND